MTTKKTVKFDGCIATVLGAEEGDAALLRAKGYMVCGASGDEIRVHLWPPSQKQPTPPSQLRADLGIGTVTSLPGAPKGMAAKCRIAELLGIEINDVNKFKKKAGLSGRNV